MARTSESSLLVWGAGGHGRVVADLIRSLGHRVAGFVDADRGMLNEAGDDDMMLLEEDDFLRWLHDGRVFPDDVTAVALGIGSNDHRFRLISVVGARLAPHLAHPSATISPSAELGVGTVVLANAVVNSRARIGAGAIINSGAVVEHDCILGRGVHVSPGAVLAGSVEVGDRAWVGAGAIIIPGITIGSEAVVGAGAVVIRDVAEASTVVGNPAKPIDRRRRW